MKAWNWVWMEGNHGKSAATFFNVWLDSFSHGFSSTTLESIPFFFINSHNIGTGGSMQEKVHLWKHVSCEVITQIRLVNSSPVDTHWAFMQAKNISPFLSSPLLFILHVRALLGAAGPSPNWALQPPFCKVVGCQTSPDLQLGAHAMRLLLWAIKGKWERDVQIPLAILT